ncbi:MAG: hypothetical protein PHU25_02420 [Deltaproteobacteria bacterium]|nr:hypothetical protein [Deltaproteobacteria bacterium]
MKRAIFIVAVLAALAGSCNPGKGVARDTDTGTGTSTGTDTDQDAGPDSGTDT